MIDTDMTVEEALRIADRWTRGTTFYAGKSGLVVSCAVLAEEIRKQREDKWRDVKEELPDEEEEVLCLLRNRINNRRTIQIAGYVDSGEWFDSWLSEEIENNIWDVIMWQYLPEDPATLRKEN